MVILFSSVDIFAFCFFITFHPTMFITFLFFFFLGVCVWWVWSNISVVFLVLTIHQFIFGFVAIQWYIMHVDLIMDVVCLTNQSIVVLVYTIRQYIFGLVVYRMHLEYLLHLFYLSLLSRTVKYCCNACLVF